MQVVPFSCFPGSEVSGAADGGKRTMRCTKRDSHGNQCIRVTRFSAMPHTHHCLFRSETIPEPKQTQIERWSQFPLEDRAIAETASLVAVVDAPLAVVEEGVFQRLVNSFVEIGCRHKDHRFHFGRGGCPLSRCGI
jgi:hypothetical protein